jgi:hypothetical protein
MEKRNTTRKEVRMDIIGNEVLMVVRQKLLKEDSKNNSLRVMGRSIPICNPGRNDVVASGGAFGEYWNGMYGNCAELRCVEDSDS